MKMKSEEFRGIWHSIHSTSAWASDAKRIEYFSSWIREAITGRLSCDNCKTHAFDYIDANPPENCDDPFLWAWRFHNNVNERLGKEIVSLKEAVHLWLVGEAYVCTGDCD